MYGKIAELGEPAIAPAAPRLRQSLGSPSNFVSSPLQGYKPEVLTSDQSSSVNSTVDSITSNMQALNSRPRTTPYRDQDQGNSEEGKTDKCAIVISLMQGRLYVHCESERLLQDRPYFQD